MRGRRTGIVGIVNEVNKDEDEDKYLNLFVVVKKIVVWSINY